MHIISGNSPREIITVDDGGAVLCKGFWNERLSSELYENDRYEYCIWLGEMAEGVSLEALDMTVYELIEIAREQHKKHPGYDGRVYSGCLTGDCRCIDYFTRIDGFVNDEAMLIINFDLVNKAIPKVPDINYAVREDSFNIDSEIQDFVDLHTTIFRYGPYSVEAIRKLMAHEGYKNISVYDGEKMIANVLLHIEEEDGVRFGWLEDLFVIKGYRKCGLGEYLNIRTLEYFKGLGLNESRLEVWSANVRATNLYYKVGYEFLKKTEVSIGMML